MGLKANAITRVPLEDDDRVLSRRTMNDSIEPSPAPPWAPRGRHLLAYDVIAVSLAIIGAFALRFDASNIAGTIRPYLPVALLPIVVQPVVNIAFGLYRREWRYASVRELVGLTAAVATAGALCILLIFILGALGFPGTAGLPRSFIPLTSLLTVALIGGGRFAVRVWWESNSGGAPDEGGTTRTPSLVYGAGEAGAAIARMAPRDPSMRLRVVGFVDDDATKRGSQLLGKRIYGGIDALAETVRATGARQLVIAMPSASGPTIRLAVEAGQALGLDVRIVPALQELLGAPDRVTGLRPVSVDDLLRRSPVHVDLEELARYINGASVLITGAGGSIGSELARQIGRLGPRRLVLLDNNEAALWGVAHDLKDRSVVEASTLNAMMGDIRSLPTLDRILGETRPDVVFHAAAMKHVPMCEQQPGEAVLTNVVGTRNLLRACEAHGVRRFVLISTDKAVHPVSVMGATKRFAEVLTLAAAGRTGQSHMAVRFGNVLGSSGSVVPIFRRQLELGIPLTITHPSATRFFMTIPEAVSLILQAGATDAMGEIYILDMGDPVRIVDLARDMIRLSGADPASVEIVYTGLRPGERLEERLYHDHESVEPTTHARVWRVPGGSSRVNDQILAIADELERRDSNGDEREIRALLIQAGMLQQSAPVAVG